MHLQSHRCIRRVGENTSCRYCRGASIKYGRNKKGAQRYRCNNCNKSFLLSYSYHACASEINTSIKEHVKEGCGIRSIARLLKISTTTVLKRILYLSKLAKPVILMGKEYEMDELCIYVKNKARQLWIVYAMRQDTKEVVDFAVGSRTNATLKRVADTLILANASKIYTDKLRQYRLLLPAEIHCTKQYGTNHIERKNLNLRTHLKRLNRRTICFSRSIAMLCACLSIYFWG